MGWPAGFKLNDKLNDFLGIVFLYYIDRWAILVNYFLVLEPLIVKCLALAGFFGGLTVMIALMLDVSSRKIE
jgi:hypothetical protein